MRTQNGKITKRRRRRRIKPRTKKSVPSIGSAAATRSQAQHRLISLHTSICALYIIGLPPPRTDHQRNRIQRLDNRWIRQSNSRERIAMLYLVFFFLERERADWVLLLSLFCRRAKRWAQERENPLMYVIICFFFKVLNLLFRFFTRNYVTALKG